MAISDILNRRVRARPDDEEILSEMSDGVEGASEDELEETDSEAEDLQSQSETSDEEDHEEQDDDDDDEDEDANDNTTDEDPNDPSDDDIHASLSNISFGALAKAQASMGSKKRKQKQTKPTTETSSTASPLDDIRARIREAREQKHEAANKSEDGKQPQEKKASRGSKHAPMVQSSKRAVTRKRTVVEPPAIAKARDPRFDAAVMGHSGAGKNPDAANKSYAFLDEYRAFELKDLKAQLAKTKNAEQKEVLKRQIRSASDRMKSMANRKREREIQMEHKKREKQLIRDGKKSNPYFLKKSDLKKQVLQKKYEEMGSRDRAKALERRRKKMAAKERKDMPMERRGMMEESGESGGGKRRRLA